MMTKRRWTHIFVPVLAAALALGLYAPWSATSSLEPATIAPPTPTAEVGLLEEEQPASLPDIVTTADDPFLGNWRATYANAYVPLLSAITRNNDGTYTVTNSDGTVQQGVLEDENVLFIAATSFTVSPWTKYRYAPALDQLTMITADDVQHPKMIYHRR